MGRVSPRAAPPTQNLKLETPPRPFFYRSKRRQQKFRKELSTTLFNRKERKDEILTA